MSQGPAAASPRVHLDLELHPDDAAALWRAPALVSLRHGSRLRSAPFSLTWHDGAARELAAAGLVLARQKRGRGAGWRLERMCPAQGQAWPPATEAPVLAEAPAPEALGTELPPGLVELASFDGIARSVPLNADAALDTVRLATGTLRSAAGSSLAVRACRVLLAGPAPQAFELARTLAETVRLEVPRAALAAMASYPDGPPPRHLGPPELPPDASPSAALAVLIGQLTDVLLYWAPLAGAERGPEPVHQMRVALRRLRSALQIFGRVVPCPDLEAMRVELRSLAQVLGAARDWDVFVHETAPDAAAAFAGERAVVRMLEAAERRRLECYAVLQAALADPAFRRLGLKLAELTCVRPWEASAATVENLPDLPGLARQALARRMRRAVAGGDDLGTLPANDLHALRLKCKRLRYAAELFAPLFPGRGARRFLRRLVSIQDRLGRLNDAAVAADLMRELGRSPGRAFAAGLICGFLEARGSGTRAKLERSWRRFRDCDPFWK